MQQNPSKPRAAFIADWLMPSLFLFGLSVGLYWNTTQNGFVIDDVDVVSENPQIRSAEGALQLLTTGYWERVGFIEGDLLYRPVTMLSFALEYAGWGLSAAWFHGTNLVLNGFVVILVFLLVARLFENRALALTTAVLYAFLPCHVEAVAPVVGRSELLSALFGFLGWLLYLRGSTRSFVASLFCFAAAIGAKENAVVFPVLILVADIVRSRLHSGKNTALAEFGTGVESLPPAADGFAQGGRCGTKSEPSGATSPPASPPGGGSYQERPLADSPPNRARGSNGPAGLTIPADPQSVIGDPRSAIRSPQSGICDPRSPVPCSIGETLRRFGAYCAVSVFYLAARFEVLGRLTIDQATSYFRGRSMLVVWLSMGKSFFALYFRWLFLGTGMNPACLRPCYGDAATDDVLAWCLLGALVLAALLAVFAYVRRPSVPVLGVLLFMLTIAPVSNFFVRIAALAGVRFLYVPSFGACLAAAYFLLKAVAPPERPSRAAQTLVSSLLVLLLGTYAWLTATGNTHFRDEETAYRNILEIAPRSHFALHNLGATLAKDKRYDEARPILEYIREQAPELDRVHYNLGLIYMEEGRLDEAEKSLRKAISRDTGVGMVSDMHVALGNLLEKKGDLRGAKEEFMHAAATRYNNSKAHNNLANSYYKEGKFAAAERHYRIALHENPDMMEAWQGLGTLLVATKRYDEAMNEVYDRALEKPEWQPWAFAGIGRCLMSLGNPGLAEDALRRAIELDGANLDALINLSALYLERGRILESLEAGERAMRAGGVDKPEVVYNLAGAYEKVNTRQALVLWRRFLELTEGNPKFAPAREAAKRRIEELSR